VPVQDRAHLTALIASLAARGRDETAQLATALRRGCWPGGSDRTDPNAREWVRRWGPRGLTPATQGCSCADGRCAVCN
jgi:hypothetical protein